MLTTVSDEISSVWQSRPAFYQGENETGAMENEEDQLYYSAWFDWNPIVNKGDYQTATIAIECGLLPSMGFLGTVVNIINMVVFYRQGLRDKMNFCLFALAFADFMFVALMFMSVFFCPAGILPDSPLAQNLRWSTLKFTLNFWYAFWYSSGMITAIIATERCICVVWPLKAAAIFKTKTMAWLIFGIIVLFNLLCLPHALKHVVREVTDENGNVTVIMDDTDLYKNNRLAFLIVRDGILSSISFSTFCIVFVVTVVTVRKLRTAMDWRQKTSSQVMDKRQMMLVKILITVSCVYIACNAPKIPLAAARLFVHEFSTNGRYKNLFFVTHRAGYGLLIINSSANIFIYFRQSSRFRKELRACFCCFKSSTSEKSNPSV